MLCWEVLLLDFPFLVRVRVFIKGADCMITSVLCTLPLRKKTRKTDVRSSTMKIVADVDRKQNFRMRIAAQSYVEILHAGGNEQSKVSLGFQLAEGFCGSQRCFEL